MTSSSGKAQRTSDTAAVVPEHPTAAKSICSLPVVGPTTIEDAVFYGTIGAVALAELVSWPVAGLIATGHAFQQRARNVVRTGAYGEAREGMIEAFEDVT